MYIFTAVTGDGQVIHIKTLWRNKNDKGAFRESKLFAWLQRTRFPVFKRVIDGVEVTVPGFFTTDHQANLSNLFGLQVPNVLSGCAANAVKEMSPAENAVNLMIQKGQRNCKLFFGATENVFSSVAQFPAIIGSEDHSYDEYLLTLQIRLRAVMLSKEHYDNLAQLSRSYYATEVPYYDRPSTTTYSIVVDAYKDVAFNLAALRYPNQLWKPAVPIGEITGLQQSNDKCQPSSLFNTACSDLLWF